MERRISARGWFGSMGDGCLLPSRSRESLLALMGWGGQKIPGLSFPLGSARLGAYSWGEHQSGPAGASSAGDFDGPAACQTVNLDDGTARSTSLFGGRLSAEYPKVSQGSGA